MLDGNTSYVSAVDLLRLDVLDGLLKSGGSLASFGVFGAIGQSTGQPQTLELPTIASVPDLSGEQTGQGDLLRFLFTALETVSRSLPAAQPLANLEAIDRACEKGWLLSTSQLCELLGVRSINGQTIDRYGFCFTRCGRNGREGAWRIEKQVF